MTPDEVSNVVVDQLAAVLHIAAARITTTASLSGDLHADSLDLVEAVEAIEERLRKHGLDVRVGEAQVASWTTVGDAVTGFVSATKHAS